MKIYNTLTKKIEQFIPNKTDEVTMYTCGPTVYHFAHIGNLRTYIFEDILEKTLNLDYKVKRCMNITDVGHLTSDADSGEDKMLKGAIRENKTVYEIADFYTNAFFSDTEKLNIKKPSIIEKASDNIETYINIIEDLLKKGFAYKANNNIYFDISKANDYYKLSGRTEDNNLLAVRDNVEVDIHKKNPADFVLWFTTSKFENQDMKWDSPFGYGYPGWHIECSGISLKMLGNKIDIHCGGVDNIHPHHTNEIAQSEAYTGSKWCNYWVHGEHLNDKRGKMSKSSGEFLTVSLLESKGYNPLSYRFLCLNSHYRKTLLFSYEALDQAASTYEKILNKISLLKETNDLNESEYNKYYDKFKESLNNDLNTSSALTTLYDVLKDDITDQTKLELIKKFDEVLSLNLIKEETKIDDNLINYIEKKIKERNTYKQNKDYAKADEIREELLSKNIIIKDTREGTTYTVNE